MRAIILTSKFCSRVGKASILCALFLVNCFSQTNVLTNRYNTSRTAANLSETQLTTANVNTSTFGKLGAYYVDGVIYAQPLYVQNVAVSGASHNVLYVATMHDVLYAFDADKIGSIPLWTIDFRNLTAGIAPAPIHVGTGDGSDAAVADTFGILSTPVIDLPNNRMFLVTHTLENGTECFRLRAVDIRTGALLASTLITASVPAKGSAPGATLVSSQYDQRPALEIISGQVWVAFGSRATGDYLNPWQGWLTTYNPNTLAQSGVFASSRTNGNSFWQSGNGPAVDASGNVYYLTANGGAYDGVTEFPESLLKMNYANGLKVLDWYTPDDANGNNYYVTMDDYDLDLSCNGPVLIPGTDLVTFGSKTADVYLLHTGNLGHLTPNDPQLAQFFHVGAPVDIEVSDSDRIVGMAYWQRTSGGSLYVWPGQDALHAYALNTATSTFTQTYAGTYNLPGQPATALSVSANGSTSGTGILWAPVMNVTSEANTVGQPGILHAYNAENPGQELWNSNMVAADNLGFMAKFVPPVVVNGKVYMANSAPIGDYGAGSLTVYGLKSGLAGHIAPSVTLNSPTSGTTFVSGSTINLSASASAAGNSSLSSVTFLDNTTVLATLTGGPFNYAWTGAAVGSHTLTARATDNTGAVSTAFAATINVTATPSFKLTAVPASLILSPGGNASTQITVTPLIGFSGAVSFSVEGVDSTLSTNFTQGSSANIFILTVGSSASTPLETTSLTVVAGTGGAIANSLSIPVIVSQTAPVSPGINQVTFTVPAGVTLGTPSVFTEGVPSSSMTTPDFRLVQNGTTCTGTVSGTCTVSVMFNPLFAGLRRGAVKLIDAQNNVLATLYLSGTGCAPGSGFAAGTVGTPYLAGSVKGVAVDGLGDVFLVDSAAKQVLKVTPGGKPVAVALGTTLNSPYGLALDAAGNLYIADAGNNRILKVPYGGGATAAVNVTGLNFPEAVAVDGAGNLFIANTRATAASGAGSVIKIAAGSGAQSTVVGSGLNYPSGVAVDAAGDLFIADKYNNRVLEIAVKGSTVSLSTNAANAAAIAVDAAGNVFVADQSHGQLLELPVTSQGPGTGAAIVLSTGLAVPYGLALDGQGDIYIANVGSGTVPGSVVEIAKAISVRFTIPSGVTLGTPLLFTEGVPNSALANPDFTLLAGGNTCVAGAAGTCTVNVQFTPQAPGLRRGAVKLVDSGNTVRATAFISGVGLAPGAAWTAGTVKTIYSAGSVRGVTADGAGNVFFVDTVANQVFKVAPGGTPLALKLGATLNSPFGLALDAGGNLYIADAGNNRILELPYGSNTAAALKLSGLNFPEGVAVDGAGNLFVANTRGTATSGNGTIVELAAGSGIQTTVDGAGLGYPSGVTVDAAGDLFIADWGNNRVLATPPFGLPSGIGSKLANASAVAVDAAGDVFVTDEGHNQLVELPGTANGPGSGTQITIAGGLVTPYGLAFDGPGNLYIANIGNATTIGSLAEIARSGATASSASVSLSAAFNVYAIFNNGSAPTQGGLDGNGYAYSETLLGGTVNWSGVQFSLGTSGAASAVSGGTVALPAGNFSALKLLAVGMNGNQPNQTFVVTYSDGTTGTFQQSISDWGSAANYAGESIAVSMSYRLTPGGSTQTGPWGLYGYSFALNSGKTVKSITLPNNRKVAVLAMALAL